MATKSTELCRTIISDIRYEIERRTEEIERRKGTLEQSGISWAEETNARKMIEGLKAAITIVENRAKSEQMPMPPASRSAER